MGCPLEIPKYTILNSLIRPMGKYSSLYSRGHQAIVIFFGSVSGVDFGKTIVKTPFAIDALMSSFCMSSHQYLRY